MFKIIQIRFISIVFLFSLFSLQAFAADEIEGITIYPHVGKITFDSGNDLGIDDLYGITFGYRADQSWGYELTFQDGSSDLDYPGMGTADINSFRFNVLYHFATETKARAYTSFGMGRSTYDFGVDTDTDKETQFNLGVGVTWPMTDRTSFRSEVQFFQADQNNMMDSALSIGFQHSFGEKKPPPPPPDSDSDGVPDASDNCPGTPAGVAVDSNGCPLDDDGDGVPNYLDKCPGTTNRRAKIDFDGCYVMTTERVSIELHAEFDFDSAEARPDHVPMVGRVATFMEANSDTDIVMEGHTDNVGNPIYNQELSEDRAKSIADILIEQFGIAASRVSSQGFGERKPIASNDTVEGRQKNRRVTAVVEAEKDVIVEK